jgi:hypothetical protein
MNSLDKLSARDGPLRRTPRVKDSAIQLFAEGKTRIELSTLNLVEALHTSFVRPGFPEGLYIALTADSPVDLAIPGAPYSLAQLHRALVFGEINALVTADRLVIRPHLSSLPESLHHLNRLLEKVPLRFRV